MIVAILPSVVRVIWSLEADMVACFFKYLLLPKDSQMLLQYRMYRSQK